MTIGAPEAVEPRAVVQQRLVDDRLGHDAGDLGQRVLGALVGPAALAAGNVALRASVGVHRITGDNRDVRAVVRDADAALFRAQHDGGCLARLAAPGEGDIHDAVLAPGPPPRPSV